jgi:DNA-3-methyladenine glycosylase I
MFAVVAATEAALLLAMPRCPWATTEPNISYHDQEWGVPVHDDRRLFEFLILEGAQAGLSWSTILKKRENYRKAFDGFRPEKIARYGKRDVQRLLCEKNSGLSTLTCGASSAASRSRIAGARWRRYLRAQPNPTR